MEPSLSDRMLEHPQVADFIAFLRLKNVSSGTIEQYRKVLRDLFRHLG